jgi:hypothetical protein
VYRRYPWEIFRKYMRYKLNEEVFNVDFVADVLALKTACELDGDTMVGLYKLNPIDP